MKKILPLLIASLAATLTPLFAQSAGVAIEAESRAAPDEAVMASLEKLRTEGKLISDKAIAARLEKPVKPGAGTFKPPAVRTTPLPDRRIAEVARQACVRVGWYYLCPRCEHRHLNLAGGYAIDDRGAVATCYHCVKPGADVREGFLVAVGTDGVAHAVTEIVAADETLDAAVVRIAEPTATPLALQDDVAPGDKAFLYSDPLGNPGYFSAGIVNRFYWKKGTSGDPTLFKDAVRLRFNAGTDWAPGSSGAALLDACGNAIGHVSTISALSNRPEGKGRPAPTLITLHEAVPARGVILLLRESGATAP